MASFRKITFFFFLFWLSAVSFFLFSPFSFQFQNFLNSFRPHPVDFSTVQHEYASVADFFRDQYERLETPGQKVSLHVRLKNGETLKFFVEYAVDESSRAQGLMFRKEMPEDEGMFFLFEKPQELSFWMKNTLIPLDIIFIGEDGKIVAIAENAQPCKEDPCFSYVSGQPAQFVLEINGGLSRRLGISKGDMVF